MTANRTNRWQHLVEGSFRLDETPPAEVAREALPFLNSVLEFFPGSVDPVDDFEGYAVRRTAKSLVRVLEMRDAG